MPQNTGATEPLPQEGVALQALPRPPAPTSPEFE